MAQEVQNVMKKISLEKLVLNIGVGKSGDAIEVAKKALDQVTGKKSSVRNAKATHRDWGVRKGEPIGVAITVRGDNATVLLKRLFEAKGNVVNPKSFDDFGNYSFGIKEHIDIPGIKYDPKIGILGLDVAVVVSRPGHNIRFRSKHKAKIGKSHQISKEMAKDFLVKEFGVTTA